MRVFGGDFLKACAEELEEEEDLLRNLVDGMGMLIKLYGERIMPVFDSRIAAVFAPFMEPSQSEALQVRGLLVGSILQASTIRAHDAQFVTDVMNCYKTASWILNYYCAIHLVFLVHV